MQGGHPKSLGALGFLTVVEHPQMGLFGGLLVLNPVGRPLEFHCTAPVKPNRAQQILFGPTLEPYLYGEQIAQTLVSKSKLPLSIVLTDSQPVLALREHIDHGVVLVLADESTGTGPMGQIAHAADATGLMTFSIGRHRLALLAQFAADREQIWGTLEPVVQRLDLQEPFERIRDAIQEAQRAA